MGYISKHGAKRIAEVVQRSERAPRNAKPGRARSPVGPGPIFHAKTGGSSIGAAVSTNQMTSGAGFIRTSSNTGAVSDTVINITIWNKETGASIPANTDVLVAEVCGLYVFLWQIGAC